MENLITKTEDGKLVVSSRRVADDFGKNHAKILRSIEGYISENPILASQSYFIKSNYKTNGNNKTYKEYLLTRDGFSLLVMGFTGSDALEWKLKYIEAFNTMEKQLKELQAPQLPQTYLEALKALVASEEEKQKIQEENKRLSRDNNHKDDVIEGLTEEISLADKRQRITQIIRYKTSNFKERYNLLYGEFNKKYHINVQLRLKNEKESGAIKKSVNTMDYICNEKYLNMTNELYEVCCKLFEGDLEKLLEEIKNTIVRD